MKRDASPAVQMLASHTGRKFLLSFGFVVVTMFYALWQRSVGTSALATLSAQSTPSPTTATPAQAYEAANQKLLDTLSQLTSTTSASSQTQSASAAPSSGNNQPAATQPAPTPKPASSGKYANGSYTGSPADAYYGTVQVKAVISGGRLADVQFLQYPYTHSNSVYINQQAMPMLTQEAIQAQSANVSGVSGATFTSEAFIQSLSSALAQAKN